MGAKELNDAFVSQADRALALVMQVESARTPTGTMIPPLQRNLVFETAFLRILLGWEAFLEDVFLHFLTGRPGINGQSFSPLVKPKSIAIARDVARGDHQYLTWTSAQVVKDRAAHWLRSDAVFAAGFALTPDLKHMVVVRNRIAHTSLSAKTAFAATRLVLAPNRTNYNGFGPGMVLRHEQGGQSNLNRFATQLKKGAAEIANGP